MPDLQKFGDYEFSLGRVSVLAARLEFIRAISDNVKGAFESLHDLPLIAYKESGLLAMTPFRRQDFWTRCIAGWREDYYLGALPDYRIDPLPEWGPDLLERTIWWRGSDPGSVARYRAEILPKLVAMRDSLIAWAKSYNLEKTGWMLHWAFLKLDAYADTDESPSHVQTYRYSRLPNAFGREVYPPENPYLGGGITSFAIPDRFPKAMEFEPFTFHLRGWVPTLEMRSDYEQMAKKTLAREIKAYLDSQAEHHHGLMPSSWKRERWHFDWLALYQCWPKRTSTIAKDFREKRTTVEGAIRGVAEFIGLTLRPDDPPGRPSGSKDKKKRVRRN